ncbi:hypothetical protein E1N52_17535 [Paraburkholderia guartelaensis]|jgi:hypothetical protein|uniref:Uncharacterized protein n=1 Tax=Paraburkholderia guartelaensis TaxID=2546446 RepID=A0A4R5LCG2_9BURK|nr:hypothetical protein [Paraburkholderia guartelaensis]TDG07050.1 hypothetical protein E1N52_17535 [Paraburkholderia guartelaensis]
MKTALFVSAAVLLGALSFAGVAQAQDATGQNQSSNSDSYGGVSGGTSASGMTSAGWSRCGHMSKCNPDSGH